MPSNWLFVHPGLNSATVNSIANRCEKITKKFTRNILYGNKVFRKMIITLPIDIAILPITFIYYVYARFIFAKTMIYTSNCNSCMICVNNCPVKAIKIVNNRPYWSYSCESCMRCINICPCASIQTSHLIFIMILIIPGFLFSYFLAGYIKLPDFLNYGFVLSIIEMAITLVELFILYAVIQRFLKYKFIGSLFKYTSFSAYWRRYRAPGISVKDFKKHATEMKNHWNKEFRHPGRWLILSQLIQVINVFATKIRKEEGRGSCMINESSKDFVAPFCIFLSCSFIIRSIMMFLLERSLFWI